ncbi:MAG TPA: CoA transferase [Pseudomonadales bacterium]|nr:CoA transferase [Pseudomonadales bacterium]
MGEIRGPRPQPFEGIEIVEFGQFIAVPYCAQLLADGGAHVIKIEALEGDPVRTLNPLAPGETRHFLSRNRGKHSLPLNLKHPSASRVIEALLARADVVLTNFRPGLARELGLDHAGLAPRYPRLIVGNVTAFGQRGPDAMLAGMDLVVQARSGLMASNGRIVDGNPAAGDPPVADYMCAMSLAFGVASALYRRATTGRGGEVDVALLAAALVVQNNGMVRVERTDAAPRRDLLARLAELRAAGAPYTEQAELLPNIRTPGMVRVYYRTYATKDAALAVACVSAGLQRAFMRATGMKDLAHERPIANPAEQQRHYDALGAAMEALMKTRTTAGWQAACDAHGLPAAGVRLPVELMDDEQVLANEMLHDLDHPALGPVRVVSNPVKLDDAGFRHSPATRPFGTETRDLLTGLGFTAGEVADLLREGVTRETK